MTENKLISLIEENDGELVFSDGFVLTDWTGGQFCQYTPDQGFGEGTVCNYEAAEQFYFEHKES